MVLKHSIIRSLKNGKVVQQLKDQQKKASIDVKMWHLKVQFVGSATNIGSSTLSE